MEKWEIEITKDSSENENFTFRRFVDDNPIETYARVDKETATMYANAIILGFEPPRKLVPLNLPSR